MNLKIEVSGIRDTIKSVEQDYQEFLERVADLIHTEAPKFTPRRTGRARAGWENNTKKNEILVENKVPYVGYLEKPFVKSRQAPQGIIGPTLTSVRGKLR